MTTTSLTRSEAPPRRPGIPKAEAMEIAATEYDRCADLFDALSPEQWAAPTVNTGWSVRDTAGHMLGMVQMLSTRAELVRQMSSSMWLARRAGAPVSIDHLTNLQVRRNADLTTGELVRRWRELAPKAVRGRRSLPAFVHGRTLPERQLVGDTLERWTVGYLVDVVLTRDPFMHRLDICAATGIEPVATPEHEGRIVDDVVGDWAARHGRPFTLELSGPAGGRWGNGGDVVSIDALDFCRVLSGRGAATGLLSTPVPF